jgi:hypothetical protein
MNWEHIVYTVRERQTNLHPIIKKMIQVRDQYDAEYVIPWLQDAELGEDFPSLAPSLVSDAIDNLALRAAGVMPNIVVPAVDGTKQTGKNSRQFAKIRRRMLSYSLNESRFRLQLYSIFRQLQAYATCALIVKPARRNRPCPIVEIRDALNAYPNRQIATDFSDLVNVGFVFGRSTAWLIQNYPEALTHNGGVVDPERWGNDRIWDMCEWIDENHTVFGIMGPRSDGGDMDAIYVDGSVEFHATMELDRWENRTNGLLPVISMGRPTLGRLVSQVSKTLPQAQMIDRMSILEHMAAEKSIFPDPFIVSAPNQVAQLRDGQWKDGRLGEMNYVEGASEVGALSTPADFGAKQTSDRMERNFRVSNGLVPQFGGETYGALRTGRGMDSLMGAAIDPRVQELHVVAETWFPRLNEIIFETFKGWHGNTEYEVHSGIYGNEGLQKFVPNKHVATTANTVSYAIAGADVTDTNIQLGQMFGMGTMSRQTLMQRHPWIDDAEEEVARIEEEMFEEAARNAILARAGDPTSGMQLTYLAKLERHRRSNPDGDIFTAIEAADKEIAEEQAAQPPAPPPGQPLPPELAPGLEGAGPAALGPLTPPVAPPPEGTENFTQLVNALGTGQGRS